jgi:hypothetical protein
MKYVIVERAVQMNGVRLGFEHKYKTFYCSYKSALKYLSKLGPFEISGEEITVYNKNIFGPPPVFRIINEI